MRSPHQNWSKIDAMSNKDIAGQIAAKSRRCPQHGSGHRSRALSLAPQG
jgi:hypothetical protein